MSRSAADCNYLCVGFKPVLEEARNVVDDDANGADEHLQTGLSHRTNSDRLKRHADRHVTVERDQHGDPDGPHLTDVNQRPHVYLAVHTVLL